MNIKIKNAKPFGEEIEEGCGMSYNIAWKEIESVYIGQLNCCLCGCEGDFLYPGKNADKSSAIASRGGDDERIKQVIRDINIYAQWEYIEEDNGFIFRLVNSVESTRGTDNWKDDDKEMGILINTASVPEASIMNKQQEELAMRLDLLIPMKWISDNYPNVEHIFSKMVELNQEWVKEVVNNANHRLTDVLHDFSGIYGNFACPPEEKDEHFLPRISTEVSDDKVNGYTNIQTYRLCLVLDNTEYWKEDILQTFFRLVREDEFKANDITL